MLLYSTNLPVDTAMRYVNGFCDYAPSPPHQGSTKFEINHLSYHS